MTSLNTYLINTIIIGLKELDYHDHDYDITVLFNMAIKLINTFEIKTVHDYIINKNKYNDFCKNELDLINKNKIIDISKKSDSSSESDDSSDDSSSDEQDESDKCTKYVTCMSRLKSFLKWQFKNEIMVFYTPITLAQAGFYYTGEKDMVKCFNCNVQLGDWNDGDIPMDEHKKHSPHCKFINSVYIPHNIRKKYDIRLVEKFKK